MDTSVTSPRERHDRTAEARRAAAPPARACQPAWTVVVRAGSVWAGVDSNHRATDYESAALTAELPARDRHYSTESTA